MLVLNILLNVVFRCSLLEILVNLFRSGIVVRPLWVRLERVGIIMGRYVTLAARVPVNGTMSTVS